MYGLWWLVAIFAFIILLVLIFYFWGCGSFGCGKGSCGPIPSTVAFPVGGCGGLCNKVGVTCTDHVITSINAVSGISGIPGTDILESGWQRILRTEYTTNQDDQALAMTVSAATAMAIFDSALAALAPNSFDYSRISLRVLVDGQPVCPDGVLFNSLAHLTVDLSTLAPADVDSFLTGRGNANAFTFLASRVCAGCHCVEVQANFYLASVIVGTTFDVSVARALLGDRSLTVETIQIGGCPRRRRRSRRC